MPKDLLNYTIQEKTPKFSPKEAKGKFSPRFFFANRYLDKLHTRGEGPGQLAKRVKSQKHIRGRTQNT